MRVFFAVEFDETIKQYIYDLQNIVKANTIKGNFSRRENFHLTLRFIGEVREDKLEDLKKALDKSVDGLCPFSFGISRLGWFDRGGKKLVWLGIDKKENGLEDFYNNLQVSLESVGIKKEERAYSPHITIVRDAVLVSGGDIKLKEIDIEEYKVKVNFVSLMESTRVNGLLTYIPVYRRELC